AIDIECNPSASHFAFEKKKLRELFVLEGSRAFCCAYVYSNLLGCESGRQIYDGGNLIALDGELIARGERFSFADHVVTTAEIDLDYSRTLFSKKHWAEPAFDGEILCVKSEFEPPKSDIHPKYAPVEEPAWEKTANPIFEEFTRAVPLALFDYMRKSYSKGFVVSLSGGCDSASVSVLAKLAIASALSALSLEGFRQRLAYIPALSGMSDENELLGWFLTTVWQQTENNSKETKDSARAVAKVVGSTHHEIAIDDWVASYKERIEQCLDTKLNYEENGLVLQNLQARIRNPLPWALANYDGKLLLTTSNRSESALGYCTMDGDTAGGLNPIGGVDKAFLRRWLKWMESCGAEGVGAMPQLKVVNELTPSAELLPLEETQSDEEDLGPYEVCTFIEDRFMRRSQSPADIFPELVEKFSAEYSKEDLHSWLRRFFVLFGRNQWKRERLAPCFHVDHMNLDPRTWCRWPILNGGFEVELAELDRVALGSSVAADSGCEASKSVKTGKSVKTDSTKG
ncbi:MAG: NAD(+) synthase, partial [Bdellovibrionales bacterium]|nr:NAD(+) synthase [Bdellovibrionales bacterium]